MNRKSGRVTVYDIAQKSGTSVATVSRVINHPSEVSEETRNHILSVMEEMGYVSDVAQKQNQSKSRGVIVLDHAVDTNPFYDMVAEGIYKYAGRIGYTVTIFTEAFLMEYYKPLMRLAKRKSVVGFISMGRREKRVLSDLSYVVPVVQCMEWRDSFISEIPSVGVGVYGAVNKAMTHLYEEGAQNIVLFDYMLTTEYGRQVLSAYKSITKAHGIDDYVNSVFHVEQGFDQAYIQALSLMQNEVPDAIVCASDELAVSVTRAADRLGIEIPDTLKVCGIGDMRYSNLGTIPLTTVSGLGEPLGEAACRMLTDRIANPYGSVVHDNINSKLIIRSSTVSERAGSSSAEE